MVSFLLEDLSYKQVLKSCNLKLQIFSTLSLKGYHETEGSHGPDPGTHLACCERSTLSVMGSS